MSRAAVRQGAEVAEHPHARRLGPAGGAKFRVADLEHMDRHALVALWAAALGGEPPARLSQPFLRRVLAWELQARAQGGLPASVTKRLDSLTAAQTRGTEKAVAPKLKAGGRLLREWNGITHVVDVVEGGFIWRGQRHRSLSAIAQAITGAHWSGPRFFGLQDGAGTAGAKKASDRDAKSPDGRRAKAASAPPRAMAQAAGRLA
ncbi:hypothetical protein Rumeso_02640 [Rubellimicrobium mesophilum DSM 19309]|uniref:Bacteriophage-related protein n=1 Tax=Rubellimicrobium mesophilum DSM 19309 TaxID=442562 RepID=A0A017HNV9_9RHOB|nr:DUF2924 domain-containing protein [Rubellimicrobium mesophilum]EYD75858.1 hypothetical protein Rumeso_02640 [Rubellimicrobium mesophilum DSM 19309]